jgi:putative membrane protein
MNFIDYVTFMLINMAAGLGVLACFVWNDIAGENRQRWAPALAIPGVGATVCGFAMSFSWPLPGPYNIAYGETSIMLGLLFLAAAWCLAKQWDLMPLGLYALPAGAIAVLIGIRFLNLGLTNSPTLSGIGFILTGAGGVFSPLVLLKPQNKPLRRCGAILLLAAAAIWAYTACMAYWGHLKPGS